MDNAIKYNREGGWVEVRGSVTDGGVALVVEDSGIGIPVDELGAVMQRFYRIDQARTPGQGGLGLGLSIARELIKAQHGDITIESELGKGSTFTMRLPLVTSGVSGRTITKMS